MACVLAKFSCRVCGLSLSSIKGYVNHQILHQHETNGYYSCCYVDCNQKFSKYTALKSHVYHSHHTSLSQCNETQTSFVCDVADCKKQCIDLKDLLAHLKVHLTRHESVCCPFRHCTKVFKVKSSFTSHLSRCHKDETDVNKGFTYTEPSLSYQSTQIENETEIQSTSEFEATEDLDIRPLYMRNLCLFYMQLQAKYLVPSSTIQMIVEEINGLNSICHQYTKDKIEETLRVHTNMSGTEIGSVVQRLQESDIHAECSSSLSTEYSRRQYFQKNFAYVHPESLYLGTNEHRKDCYAQYIPLSNTLRTILKDPVVWQECAQSQNHQVSDGILRDICDGSVFKSQNLYSQAGDIILKLILYQDAFEVVNPLGSAKKKHKLVGVYFTLADFEPFHRSSIDNMELVLLCKETDFKSFGQDRVFSRMLSDLKQLEEQGLVTTSGHVVRATVASIVGDNLGSHCIGGYTQNFSTSKYFCRYCEVRRKEIENVNQSFPVRTVEAYKEAVQLLQENDVSDVKGIHCDSVFNSMKYFHVCQPGLPPCNGHDLFEGVVAHDLAIYLRYFIKVKHWFTYSQLNRRITQFAYKDSDSASSLCQVNEKANKIGGQAAENWCLLRLLPVIIGDKVDPDDQVWQLVITLKELVELVCAPSISTAQVAYLNVIVVEYLEIRKDIFPTDHLKPKHHYLLHYPSLILKLGPLIRLWTMRFESKHSYFKRCVRRIQNFKNVCQSLANQHQLLQTILTSSSFFPPVLKLMNSTPYHANLYSDAVRKAVETSMLTEPDTVSTEVNFKGTLYKKGSFLCLARDSDDSIKFGLIELVLTKDEKEVCFVVVLHSSVHISEYGVYEIKQSAEDMRCVNAGHCLDFYPLPLYSLNGHKVITQAQCCGSALRFVIITVQVEIQC